MISIDIVIYSKSLASIIMIIQIFISGSVNKLDTIVCRRKKDSTFNFHIDRPFFLSRMFILKQVIDVLKDPKLKKGNKM